MPFFRLVIAWLVMAALPLQGFAAASMLYCGQAAHSTAAQHGGHDHSAHDHAAQDESAHHHSQAAASHGHVPYGDADGDHASTDGKLSASQADTAKAGGQQIGDDHACPICASCCNLVALFESPTPSFDADSPVSQPLPGASRVTTRVAPAPDKPPRA
jgi:hypothetical protein